MRRSPALTLTTAIATLALFLSALHAQPVNDKEWQTATIASDSITIRCEDLLLPFETGDLLQEPDPIGTDSGEMTGTLRSPHEIKLLLQPQTGTTDSLAAITGCAVDGTELWLATQDTGDAITVVHEAGVIELVPTEEGGADVILAEPNTILKLVRKAGRWIQLDSIGGTGGGGASSLNTAHQLGNEITGATSERPFMAGDGTRKAEIYGDATQGTVWRATPDQDFSFFIPTDHNFCLYDVENSDTAILCIDPDAPETENKYLFPDTAYQPWQYVWFPAEAMKVLGGCSAATEETLVSGGPKAFAIQCTDNDVDTVQFEAVFPGHWNGEQIHVFLNAYSITNQSGTVLQVHVSGRCGLGVHTTSGEQAVSVTFGAAAPDEQTSADSSLITLNGTCTAKSKVYFQAQIDAAATTASLANARILGIGIFYRVTSLSN